MSWHMPGHSDNQTQDHFYFKVSIVEFPQQHGFKKDWEPGSIAEKGVISLSLVCVYTVIQVNYSWMRTIGNLLTQFQSLHRIIGA